MLLAAARARSNAHIPLTVGGFLAAPRPLAARAPRRIRVATYSSKKGKDFGKAKGLKKAGEPPGSRRQTLVLQQKELVTTTPLGEELKKSGLFRQKRGDSGAGLPKNTDRSRVAVAGEQLCDDILGYYGHTLRDRHQGCDIIDIFPGPGAWSTKLNDFLQPRSHILLEPEAELYKPFLQPLIERPGTRLLTQSGISWTGLDDFLNPDILPHQVEAPPVYPPKRNDTLLVTANLCWHPARSFHEFSSVAQLVLFQFLRSITRSNIYQRYGLVRMLVWVKDDEKDNLIPRNISSRRRMALDADMCTEWVVEVAGAEMPDKDRTPRDINIDLHSCQNVIQRMQQQGITIPPGRESRLYQQALASEKIIAGQSPLVPIEISTPALANATAQLAKLVAKTEKAEDVTKADKAQMSRLKKTIQLANGYIRERRANREELLEIWNEAQEILKLVKVGTKASLTAAQKRGIKLDANLDVASHRLLKSFPAARDNMRAFLQSPPVLAWDRRPVEPLIVKPEEFLPNIPCTLLDIQPRAPSRHLWQSVAQGGNEGKRMPDLWAVLESHLVSIRSFNVEDTLKKIHPGADQDIIPNCPSLRDPDLGGWPIEGGARHMAPVPRTLNAKQLEEILDAWAASPFSPDFYELLKYVSSGTAPETVMETNNVGNAMARLGIHHIQM